MKQVIFLICIISGFELKAQNLQETFNLGNSLFEAKSYENAVDVYKRVLFFDENNDFSADVYPKIASSLYETQQFEEAAKYYELAYFSTEDEYFKNEFTLKKLSCHLLVKQLQYAEIELLNLSEGLTDLQKKEEIFFEGTILYAKNDFVNAEKSFKNLVSDTLAIDLLFRKNEKVNKINPKKAKILSMIMPGLGQFYVGDIKNGLNSFLLTGGLLALGVRSAFINHPIDAAIAVLPWFQRYYQGGFNKAEIIAKAKIDQKRYEIYNEIIDLVENK
jgi:tetratricopeptide (TPR) repeat protein